jgi:putative membrane protein
MSTLFAFLHHLFAFTLVAAIAVEFVLIGQVQGGQGLTHAIAKRLVKADAVLGLAAGLLLVVGLCRVFFFEKGETYYMNSHAFLAKISIFIVVGLLSIMPTMEFLSWKPAIAAGQAPRPIRRSSPSSRNSSTPNSRPSSSSCSARPLWRAAGGFRASSPHPEERAVSAFTRVFDALWPASRRMKARNRSRASRAFMVRDARLR